MNDVSVGQVGEIVYRAPTLMAGYWNDPQATAEAFAGGWFHSGDLVRMDEEGYVWVPCPTKSLDLSDLEDFLTERLARYKHPKVLEVVDALPRNPAGKVLETELRARFGVAQSIDAGESSSAPTVSAGAGEN